MTFSVRVQKNPAFSLRVLPRAIPLDSTIAIGTVTTLPAGSLATVSNVGTPSAAVLNFGLPQGALGAPGLLQAVVAGANISVDNTNPASPVVSATGLQPLDSDLTAIAALTTTAAGRNILTLASNAAIRDALDAPVYVANRTALAALSVVNDTVAIIYNEGGRNGTFLFSSSNLSTLVTADTAQGVYVAPASDTTGASGAWVRKNDGKVFATWFGLDPAATATANTTALTAAFNFARTYTGAVHIPSGDYNLNAVSITMTGNSDALHITGDGYGKTNLRWNNTDGITITMVSSPWWFMGDASGPGNAVTVKGLSFIQGATTGAVGKALAVNGQNLGGRPAPFFLASECVFRSNKSVTAWAKGIELTSVSSATIEKTYWYGALSTPTLGTFIDLIASVGKDASPYHIRGCEAYFFGTAVNAGSYVEGVHVTDCDFVQGTYGVVWDGTTSGGEAQLCMTGCHVNVTTRGVWLTKVFWSQITSNLFFISGTDQIAIHLVDSSSTTISGNATSVAGTNGTGVNMQAVTYPAGNYSVRASTITNNVFEDGGIGVSLSANVRNVTVANNKCDDGTTSEVIDVSGLNYVYDSKRTAIVPVATGTATAGAGTYTVQSGWHKRCGDHVEFSLQLTWTAHTGTGSMRVSWPSMYTPSSVPAGSACAFYCTDLTFTGVPQAVIGSGNASIILRQATTGGAASDIPVDASACTMIISGKYPIGA
ncbi:hypothetical protein CK227_10505 [Mesorhizobium sp. WSM4308]|uniref:right-handed parallel beta-helix repeat-containing protein n=1 Tax=Mesorhizobium sp. WSM4308 TaxID=2029409 RepID=UPI000BB02115|nr:right-handed parallel beta-helix repeat-containing protein [Mesorhizobium sp. WSM4308]PBB75214.1 hypothetical protein CK227_10505 [Mesorhizobium sp. WSM4308]